MPGLLLLLALALALVLLLATLLLAREALHPRRRTAAYAIAHALPCDPGDLGMAFEQWWLDLPDGARLPVWDVTTGRAADHTLVFVHDWGESRINALTRSQPLLECASRTIFYDLRGHGDAESPGTRLGHEEHGDLIALIDRLGDGPFVLIGRGMGALIAMNAAADERVRNSVAAVIAEEPYDDAHAWLRRHLQRQGYPVRPMSDLLILALRLLGRPPARVVTPGDVPALVMHEGATTVRGGPECVREFIHRAGAHHRADTSAPASEAAAT
jgi:pimeloyl-ACP methyl ester carboxylesterase